MPRESSLAEGDVFACFVGHVEEYLARIKPFRGIPHEGKTTLRENDKVSLVQIIRKSETTNSMLIATFSGQYKYSDLKGLDYPKELNGAKVTGVFGTDSKGFVRGWCTRVGPMRIASNMPYPASEAWIDGAKYMSDEILTNFSGRTRDLVEVKKLDNCKGQLVRTHHTITSNAVVRIAQSFLEFEGNAYASKYQRYDIKNFVPVWEAFPESFFPGTWYFRPEHPAYDSDKHRYPPEVVEAIENGTYKGFPKEESVPSGQSLVQRSKSRLRKALSFK